MKISLIQMNSQNDKAANLQSAGTLIKTVVRDENPQLVVLPEYFAFLDDDRNAMHASAETFPGGETWSFLSETAARHGVTLHAGSIVEKEGEAFYNTSLVFGTDGRQIARYRKIHLFDVETPEGIVYRESDSIHRGGDVVTYKIGNVTVGCGICYDIRFPELFQRLRDLGADIIVLPAAFTLSTGKDHWEILARARAIETQTYFVAVGQTGTHASGRKACYGHSMVVNPWGHVIAQSPDFVTAVTARLDPDYLETVRRNLPVANHRVLNTLCHTR
ncbi:carbon-nitrogen hydrolase family protein [Rhizobium sp. SSA_523]|uniref:carbon-nitrogen hydrolase family protein n=1 Tax=Rhizobium sp. SSA_523 TaxID=2952477 RepID=UPI002091E0CF|nr:carbon-nitrogen hydrolase family protein [Rhizobium sp. SSA_523]MCO5731586.1 carbon-nitrogen hydrolase family protein [Rhizobium sp. SSA_523]WKC21900.1 carbon-nitrogen hydrolase family protein [Rhizobium sp. SSA_523]